MTHSWLEDLSLQKNLIAGSLSSPCGLTQTKTQEAFRYMFAAIFT